MASATGASIAEAISLDFTLRRGVRHTSAEINIYEFAILRALEEERTLFERESIKPGG